jgi:hypothetical protein
VVLRDDLPVIERSIKQLQIEWEKFFGGVERRPPLELRGKLEALIRRHADAEIRNGTDRFRYQGLVARYNVFSEMWNKRLRAIEEGRTGRTVAGGAVPHRGPGTGGFKKLTVPPHNREVRIGSNGDGDAVRVLYDRFVDQRQQSGETGTVTYQAFEQQVARQTAKLRGDNGVKAVDYRVDTEAGKVTLRARAVK